MTVRDDGGNVAIDYVWGNLPMQPNDDRGENTLDPALDNHSTAIDGYQGYPGYVPNSQGGPAIIGLAATVIGAASFPSWSTMYGYGWSDVWAAETPILVIDHDASGTPTSYYYNAAGTTGMKTPTTVAGWVTKGLTQTAPNVVTSYVGETSDVNYYYTLANGFWTQTQVSDTQASYQTIYNVDSSGNLIEF